MYLANLNDCNDLLDHRDPFMVTTLTNLLLLTAWFAKRSRFATEVLGQVLGFSGLLFLSLAPDFAVH
jgi:hypothetical protein